MGYTKCCKYCLYRNNSYTAALDRAFVSAVASRSKKELSALTHLKFMKNNDDLLNDSTIDTVYIPPPNSLHKKWTVKAMEAGKHVLLEKPAALTEEKMIEIKRASEANNVIFDGSVYVSIS